MSGNIISGNVVLAGVTVFCQPVPAQGSDGKGVVRQTTSDLSGNYSFSGLSSGVYRITPVLAGFVFPNSKIVTIVPTHVTETGFTALGDNPVPFGAGGWPLVDHTIVPSDITNLNFAPTVLGGGSLPPTPVSLQLGTASNYALLAAAGITNTGNSVISGGNIGSYPTATITGFPPGTFVPPAGIDNVNSQQARADGLAAYNFYSSQAFTTISGSSANLSALGNGATASTWTPGNYFAGSSIDVPTSVSLDAKGNANALFVFWSGSTTTLESGASIILLNGAQAKNVVWLVGSSFTSVYNGISSVMVGNILANTSITLGGGVLNGRALAGLVVSSGAVTIAAADLVTVPAA